MSADDNAPEQAREVEVVGMTHAVETVLLNHGVDDLVDVATLARSIVEATETFRAAERQEGQERAWEKGYSAGWADAFDAELVDPSYTINPYSPGDES